MSDIQNPGPDMSGAGPVDYRPAAAVSVDSIAAVRARHEAGLMAISGVTFVGVAEGGLQVGVLNADVVARVPRELEGVPVSVTVTGPVDALPTPSGLPRPR